MADEASDLELYAYIDGQLDPARRFAVESRLAADPERAAWVMGELSQGSALRLLAADPRPLRPDTMAQAAKLGAPPRRPRARLWLGGASMAAAAAIALVLALPGGPPAYVDYAVNSHRVALLRAQMTSQVETPVLNTAEIGLRTNIDLPRLPANWRVTDVQLFPTSQGAALMIAVTDERGRALSLFAVNAPSDAPERPDAIREGDHSVAYWRRAGMSYALTGDVEPRAIDASAEELVRHWS